MALRMTEGPTGIHCAEALGELPVAFLKDVPSIPSPLQNEEMPEPQNQGIKAPTLLSRVL